MRKKIIALIIGVATIGFLLVVMGPCGSMIRIAATHRKMQSASYYQEAAKQLALYCQSVDHKIRDDNTGWILYPKIIRELKPFYGHISPEGARVTIGGGFYPLGYFLEPNESASDEEHLAWDLYIYSEGGTKNLFTVTLSREDRIPRDELVGNAVRAYDKDIKRAQRSVYPHKSKINYLLLFNQTEAAYKACQEAIKHVPAHWWPRLTSAFLESGMGKPDAAYRAMSEWADENPSFPHYFYLAYYCYKEDRVPQFSQAAKKALGCPLAIGGHTFNVYYFGQNLAAMAYELKEYDTAIAVCDAMEDSSREAERATSSKNPYGDFGVLRRAIKSKDIVAGDNWLNHPYRGRFNPYQTSSTNAVQPITVGKHRFPDSDGENDIGTIDDKAKNE